MLKRGKNLVFFTCLLFSFSTQTFPQAPVSFNYSVEHGLPSSETYDILKDSKGFIWIATDRGVCRFDGYQFNVFTTRDGLSDNTIFNIFEDEAGRIWFTAFNGSLSYYLNGKIFPYKYNALLAHSGLKSRIIRSFTTHHDSLFIGTLLGGIWSISPDGKLKNAGLDSSFSLPVFYFKEVGKTVLYGCYGVPYSNTSDEHMRFIFQGFGRTLTGLSIRDKSMQVNCTAIKRKNGRIVFYCPGLLCEVSPSGKIVKVKVTDDIVRITEDQDSCLWISVKKKGIKQLAPNAWIDSRETGIFFENETITNTCTDHEGGLWFSSLDNGVYFIPNIHYRLFGFRKIKNDVTCLAANRKGQVFFGTKNGRVGRINAGDMADSGIVEMPAGNNSSVYSLFCDSSGRLYIGGSRESGRSDASGYTSYEPQSCRSILFNERKNILCLLNFSNIVLKKPRPPLTELLRIRFNFHADVAFSDRTGRTWVGGTEGLFYIRNNELIKARNDSILGSRISDIGELPGGLLVVSSIGRGIIIWDQKNKPLVIDEKNGLCNNLVNGITVAGDTIWVATSNGLARVITRHGKIQVRNYYANNGLPTNELRKVIKTGRYLWLACAKGVVRVDAEYLSINPGTPPVYLKDIEVNGKQFPVSSGDTIHLAYDYGLFKIDFVGLSYKQKGKVDYQYTLEGLSSKQEPVTSTYAQFTSLDPGNYVFKVYARNDAGRWSERPAVLLIKIASPYWQTWWFRGLLLTLIILTTYLVVYLRMAQQRQRSRMLEMINTYRLQALASQMNPHFIFNILNTIQSLVMLEDRKNASRYLTKFSRLMRLELNNLRKEYVTVEEEMDMLNLYLELEQLRFSEKFDYRIEFDPEVSREFVIPAMLIQPLVENSIRHGILHLSDRKGMVSVELKKENGFLLCTVEDNGVGREKSEQLREKDHASAGLHITMQRLKLLSENIPGGVYRFVITDKKDDNGHPTGTRITFIIPAKKHYEGNK